MSKQLKRPIRYDMYSQMFFDADNNHILDMRGFGWMQDPNKQDALALQIVEIINNHDRLVSELGHVVKALETVNSFGATKPIIEHARKLLAELNTQS